MIFHLVDASAGNHHVGKRPEKGQVLDDFITSWEKCFDDEVSYIGISTKFKRVHIKDQNYSNDPHEDEDDDYGSLSHFFLCLWSQPWGSLPQEGDED